MDIGVHYRVDIELIGSTRGVARATGLLSLQGSLRSPPKRASVEVYSSTGVTLQTPPPQLLHDMVCPYSSLHLREVFPLFLQPVCVLIHPLLHDDEQPLRHPTLPGIHVPFHMPFSQHSELMCGTLCPCNSGV